MTIDINDLDAETKADELRRPRLYALARSLEPLLAERGYTVVVIKPEERDQRQPLRATFIPRRNPSGTVHQEEK